MKPALLDTNVLLALAWPNHQHHGIAHGWFRKNADGGWATCAVTELGFVRLSSNPAFTANAVAPRDAAMMLKAWTQHAAHRFFDSPPAGKMIYERALGHQQVTDAWLVETARANKGVLVTLDARVIQHAAAGELGLVAVIAG